MHAVSKIHIWCFLKMFKQTLLQLFLHITGFIGAKRELNCRGIRLKENAAHLSRICLLGNIFRILDFTPQSCSVIECIWRKGGNGSWPTEITVVWRQDFIFRRQYMGVEVPFHVRIKIQTHNIHTIHSMHPDRQLSIHTLAFTPSIRFLPILKKEDILTWADEFYLFAHILICSDSVEPTCMSYI